ncbi:hypothetical protein WICPIJ_003739 [Wickerhamomyces pijperi]|uniref:Conserved oligomeric Golgi complex subunit 3 n=1 Tax=Wickerhamomyces pijperi TaxID=599730 RepID=A0A9P8TNK6_WICPI|nr:hypothetical protein WICPIJ_003739 [Wickerhamomyces pijperi]
MSRPRRNSNLSSSTGVSVHTRQRRHSIVERIASSSSSLAASYASHQIVDGSLSSHHQSLKKENSVHKQPLLVSKQPGVANEDLLMIFPLTSQEKQDCTDSFLDQFQYQVLPSDDQLKIKDQFHVKYQSFLDSCSFRQRQYGDLLKQSDGIISDLRQLTLSYDTVSHDTETFQSEANSLITQYEKYSKLNDELKSQLTVYERLDPITRRLNNPNPNIVRKSSFHDLLAELDHCLSVLRGTTGHKESALYAVRFKRCQVRALTMVRNYVIGQIRYVGQDISKKLQQGSVNEITRDALIYTRFTEDLQEVKSVTEELCSRIGGDEEYVNLFNDCLHAYFAVRASFIQTVIKDHFNVHDSMTSLTQFTQNNITFLERLFHSEAELYYQVFSTQSESLSLSSWFTELSEPLYDSLRHRVLREASISNLCGLISLLEKYYEYDEDELEELMQLQHSSDAYEPSLIQQQRQGYKMSQVLLPILQDTQTRLIFRIQSYINDQITHYKPQASDFQISQRKNANNNTSTIPAFPPLDKALLLLSKIYGHIPSQVFTSLTHTITHDLIQSLLITSRPLVSKYIGHLEGEVWLIRELLRLNQSLGQYEFDGDISGLKGDLDTVIDFSGTVNFLKGIISQSTEQQQQTGSHSRSRRASAWDVISESIPRVKTEYIDSRLELQSGLAKLVDSFDTEATKLIMAVLQGSNTNQLDELMMKFRDSIMLTYKHLYGLLNLYIPTAEIDIEGVIRSSLIDSVGPAIAQAYTLWFSQTFGNRVPDADVMDVDGVNGFIEGVVLRIGKEQETSNEILDGDVDDSASQEPLAVEL